MKLNRKQPFRTSKVSNSSSNTACKRTINAKLAVSNESSDAGSEVETDYAQDDRSRGPSLLGFLRAQIFLVAVCLSLLIIIIILLSTIASMHVTVSLDTLFLYSNTGALLVTETPVPQAITSQHGATPRQAGANTQQTLSSAKIIHVKDASAHAQASLVKFSKEFTPILSRPFSDLDLSESFERIHEAKSSRSNTDLIENQSEIAFHEDDLFGALSWVEGVEVGLTPYTVLAGVVKPKRNSVAQIKSQPGTGCSSSGSLEGDSSDQPWTRPDAVTSLHSSPMRFRNKASDQLFLLRAAQALGTSEAKKIDKLNRQWYLQREETHSGSDYSERMELDDLSNFDKDGKMIHGWKSGMSIHVSRKRRLMALAAQYRVPCGTGNDRTEEVTMSPNRRRRNKSGKLIDEQDLVLSEIFQNALVVPYTHGLASYRDRRRSVRRASESVESKENSTCYDFYPEGSLAEFELKIANATPFAPIAKPGMRTGADTVTLEPSREDRIEKFDNLSMRFARIVSSLDLVSANSTRRKIDEDDLSDSDQQDNSTSKKPQIWQILNPEAVTREISFAVINVLTPLFNEQCNNVLSGFYCALCMIREFARNPMDQTPLHDRESYSLSICFSTCRCVQWAKGMWGGNSGVKQARLEHDVSIPTFFYKHNITQSANDEDRRYKGLRGLVHELQLPREVAGGGGFPTQSNLRLSHELLEAVYRYSIAPTKRKALRVEEKSIERFSTATPRNGANGGVFADSITIHNTHNRPPTSIFSAEVGKAEDTFRMQSTTQRHPAHRHKTQHPGILALMRDYFGKDLSDPMFRTLTAPSRVDASKFGSKQAAEDFVANFSNSILLDYFHRPSEEHLTSFSDLDVGSRPIDLNSEGSVHRAHYHTIFDRHLESFVFLFERYRGGSLGHGDSLFPTALRIDTKKQSPKNVNSSLPHESQSDSSEHREPTRLESDFVSPDDPDNLDAKEDQSTARKLLTLPRNMSLRQRNEARQYFAAKIDSETERFTARIDWLNETRQLKGVSDLTPLDRQSVTVERMKSASLLAIPRGLNVIDGDENDSEKFNHPTNPHVVLDSNVNWLHFTAEKFISIETVNKQLNPQLTRSGGDHPQQQRDAEREQPRSVQEITNENADKLLPSLTLLPTLTSLEILSILHRLSDRGNKLILFAGDSMLREMFLHLIHRIRYSDRNHAGHLWRTRCGKKHRNFLDSRNSPRTNTEIKNGFSVDYCGLPESKYGRLGDNRADLYHFFDDQPPFFDFFHHNDIIYSVFPDGDVIHQYLQVMGKSRNRRLDFMFRRKLEEMRDDPVFSAKHGMTKAEHDEVEFEESEDSILSKRTNSPSQEEREPSILIDDSHKLNQLYSGKCPLGIDVGGHTPQIPFSYCHHPQRHLRPLFQMVYMWDPMTSSRVETWIESPKFKFGRSLRTRGFDISVQINAKPYWEVELKKPRYLFAYLYDSANRFQHAPYPNQTHHIFLNSPIPKRQTNMYENYKNYLYTRKNAALWYIAKEIHQSREVFHNTAEFTYDVRHIFNFTKIVEAPEKWAASVEGLLPKFTTTTAPAQAKGSDRKLPFWPGMPSSAKSIAIFDWDKLQQLHQFSTSDLKHFACCLSHATGPHDRHPKFISKSLSYFTKALGAWSGERHYSDLKMASVGNQSIQGDIRPDRPFGTFLTRKELTERLLSNERYDIIAEEYRDFTLNTSYYQWKFAMESETPNMRRFINAMTTPLINSPRGQTHPDFTLGEQQLFRDFMAARSISQSGVISTLLRSENEEQFANWMKFNVRRQPGAATVRRIDDELQCRDTADWAALQSLLFYLGGLETTY